MKYFKTVVTVQLIALLLSSPSFAGPAGQIDFADLSGHYGDPKVEINLTAALMRMVGSFAKKNDPEVAELLSKLEFINVRVYQMNGQAATAVASIEDVSKKLKRDKWETLVTVNDEGERVRIFSKSTNEVIDGIVVMAVSPEKEGGEAVFINIVGEIDPAKISTITESLDIDLGQ